MRDMSGETISQDELNKVIDLHNKFRALSDKQKLFFLSIVKIWDEQIWEDFEE